MPNIGPLEIAIVLIIALIVFGPKRLPELGQSLGKGIREFRGTLSGEGNDQAKPRPEVGQVTAEVSQVRSEVEPNGDPPR